MRWSKLWDEAFDIAVSVVWIVSHTGNRSAAKLGVVARQQSLKTHQDLRRSLDLREHDRFCYRRDDRRIVCLDGHFLRWPLSQDTARPGTTNPPCKLNLLSFSSKEVYCLDKSTRSGTPSDSHLFLVSTATAVDRYRTTEHGAIDGDTQVQAKIQVAKNFGLPITNCAMTSRLAKNLNRPLIFICRHPT